MCCVCAFFSLLFFILRSTWRQSDLLNKICPKEGSMQRYPRIPLPNLNLTTALHTTIFTNKPEASATKDNHGRTAIHRPLHHDGPLHQLKQQRMRNPSSHPPPSHELHRTKTRHITRRDGQDGRSIGFRGEGEGGQTDKDAVYV